MVLRPGKPSLRKNAGIFGQQRARRRGRPRSGRSNWTRVVRERVVSVSDRRRRRDRRVARRRAGGRAAVPRDAFPDAVCRLPIRSGERAAIREPSDSTDSFGDRGRHNRTCAPLFQFSRRRFDRRRVPEFEGLAGSRRANNWPICHMRVRSSCTCVFAQASAGAVRRHSSAAAGRGRSGKRPIVCDHGFAVAPCNGAALWRRSARARTSTAVFRRSRRCRGIADWSCASSQLAAAASVRRSLGNPCRPRIDGSDAISAGRMKTVRPSRLVGEITDVTERSVTPDDGQGLPQPRRHFHQVQFDHVHTILATG